MTLRTDVEGTLCILLGDPRGGRPGTFKISAQDSYEGSRRNPDGSTWGSLGTKVRDFQRIGCWPSGRILREILWILLGDLRGRRPGTFKGQAEDSQEKSQRKSWGLYLGIPGHGVKDSKGWFRDLELRQNIGPRAQKILDIPSGTRRIMKDAAGMNNS